ncbi:ParB N-terminal domain-containing protein [Persicobacter diffluens]|uniref:ParB/Sulfiredoxin domain-containing protein n=1 Tax=Persicobacter diffluens TaxID=981 RepID=A0AAN5ANT9_9BACT|nr:hypothetical protein PEDI_37300 [Persicobacter diffluens]
MAKKKASNRANLDTLNNLSVNAQKFSQTKVVSDGTLADEIKKNITIHPELQKYIRPLSESEYQILEQNIMANNRIFDPLIVWKSADKYYLVDGHHRYSIAQKHKVDFNIALLDNHPDMEAVKVFMDEKQLGQRNMTGEEIAFLRGATYEHRKIKDPSQKRAGGGDTAEELSQVFHVNPKTIKRDALFYKGAIKLPDETRQMLIQGALPYTKRQIEDLGRSEMDGAAFLEQMESKKEKTATNVANPLVKPNLTPIQKQENFIRNNISKLMKERNRKTFYSNLSKSSEQDKQALKSTLEELKQEVQEYLNILG